MSLSRQPRACRRSKTQEISGRMAVSIRLQDRYAGPQIRCLSPTEDIRELLIPCIFSQMGPEHKAWSRQHILQYRSLQLLESSPHIELSAQHSELIGNVSLGKVIIGLKISNLSLFDCFIQRQHKDSFATMHFLFQHPHLALVFCIL